MKVSEAIVQEISDPIIVYPGGWGSTIPDWLKEEIKTERIAEAMKKTPTGTDAEVCAYLMTASLCMPLDSDWTEIFLHITNIVLKKVGKQLPEDIKELPSYKLEELIHLKRWINDERKKHSKKKILKGA